MDAQARVIESALRAVNPAVRLVRARHLRRAEATLVEDGELAGLAHPEAPLRVARERAAALGIFPPVVTDGHERELLLFTDPDDRMVSGRRPWEVVRHYWEALFAAAVEDRVTESLKEGGVENRWETLGPAVKAEAKFLLASDRKVPADATDEQLYVAFAAEFARTRYFHESVLDASFPSAGPAAVLAVIGADADLDAVLKATKPIGADVPRIKPLAEKVHRPEHAKRYAEAAEQAAAVNNHARAAVLHQKAARVSTGGMKRHYEYDARASLAALVPRLARVMGWDGARQKSWEAALEPLSAAAAGGFWPAGAKALYDLQRIAIDLEQSLYAVDPPSWFRSLGRRPMVRELTIGRDVVLLLHLKRVHRHLTDTPLSDGHRQALDALLDAEIAAVEHRVREKVGERIREAFDVAGFVADNPAEAVAREKVVQELLDVACERGQIRLGHLRDSIARNRLKLADLSGPVELLRGDVLLRADAELDRRLDGVYVRGEVYLRAIQRGSAVAFGTRTGRALCLYLLGPVVAAFLLVEFAKYLAHELGKVYGFLRSLVRHEDDGPPLLSEDGKRLVELTAPEKHGLSVGPESLVAVGVLSVVILGLIHSPPFRSFVWSGAKLLWRGVVWAFGLPFRAWRSPPVVAVRRHPVTRWVASRLGLALLLAGGAALFLWLFGASTGRILRFSGFTFAVAALFANSWVGRWFTEETEEALSDFWRRVRADLLPNLFGWIVWLFKELLGAIERGLYAVDEWLRFRTGETRPSLVLKVVAGVLWFPVAYVFRFVVYLFVEPQINPVKHFPVVTVSHKLLLPLIPTLAPTVAATFQMSEEKAFGLLTVVFGSIPGVFGFIAWELKENWRLYAANRPTRLDAVALGHHGESMRGLLRAGFHSGTVPAYFRKIRVAVRKAERAGQPVNASKYRDGLHHVEHAIRAFLDRELAAALKPVGLDVRAGHVHLGLQSVTAEVERVGHDRPAVLAFDLVDGQVSGRIAEDGFSAELRGREREAWKTAVAGVMAMAAVPIPEDDARVEWDNWAAFWKTNRSEPDA